MGASFQTYRCRAVGIIRRQADLWALSARSRVLAVDLPPAVAAAVAAADLTGPRWSGWRWLATARGLPIPAA
uniref:Uncharacterized protein n=1 Tax=Nocardioides zeicaulis TaxID=1776857 RepID=A0ABV6E3I9_9ACTN